MLYHDMIRRLLLPGGSSLHIMVQGAVEYLPVSRLKVGERDPAVRSRGLPQSSEWGWAAAAVGLPVRFGRVASLRHTRPGLVPKVVRLSRGTQVIDSAAAASCGHLLVQHRLGLPSVCGLEAGVAIDGVLEDVRGRPDLRLGRLQDRVVA